MVAAVASATALGVLAGPDLASGQPLAPLIAERRTLGIIATSPNWEWFPTVLPDMAHQHAPQSVWIVVPPQPDCTICGEHPLPPPTREQGAALAELLSSLTSRPQDETSTANR